MDPWLVYAGFFNILLIEEGDHLTEMTKSNSLFKIIFVFVSVLSFVRSFKKAIIIITLYYSIKILVEKCSEQYTIRYF